ncbi:MAG: DUF3576 domain-containing protein [Pseudomonadota bacterium]
MFAAAMVLVACGGSVEERRQRAEVQQARQLEREGPEEEGLFDLFENTLPAQRINVNKHLWAASLEILSFLPIDSADPFAGVITTDWGQVQGSSDVYRATVLITQPALDARSLRLAVFRRVGARSVPASDETARALEDAILTRARQLRVAGEL